MQITCLTPATLLWTISIGNEAESRQRQDYYSTLLPHLLWTISNGNEDRGRITIAHFLPHLRKKNMG